jgi:hypothetical protein
MANEHVSTELRRAVTERARACCEYCRSQARFAPQAFSVEHIIPRSKGGETVLDNLALACQGCNNHKYTRTTGYDGVNQRPVALYHPRQHQWHEHFAWNQDFTLLVGLTPTGRATVETLQLNREGLVNLRRVLTGIGEHPPHEPQ